MAAVNPGYYFGDDSDVLCRIRELDPSLYYIVVGGRPIESLEEIQLDERFLLNFKLLGGKGGFGSLLRSFRINKSANQLMCRDLTGRRLADVKEEERLRKWIAKRDQREKAKQQKETEKLEKLRNGNKVKHHFKDKKYMRQRDVLLDQLEDAVEAGMKEASPEEPGCSSSVSSASSSEGSMPPAASEPPAVVDEDDEDDSDLECMPIARNRKRKVIVMEEPKIVEEKKLKVELPTKKIAIKKIQLVTEKALQEKAKQEAENIAPPKEFPAINLEEFDDAKKLEELGLEHLKHALESRGLKCGGSLAERAQRLFSVKGLAPNKYPKKILAAPKKK